jgi:hypothetical protein
MQTQLVISASFTKISCKSVGQSSEPEMTLTRNVNRQHSSLVPKQKKTVKKHVRPTPTTTEYDPP